MADRAPACTGSGGRTGCSADQRIWFVDSARRSRLMVSISASRRGEIYGFLGPNGAGKSTVVRILCTLLRPSAGTAWVAGHDVTEDPQSVRLRIGVALQDAALDDRQTGRELLSLQGRLYGLSAAQIRMRLGEVLDLVDIGDAIDRRIGILFGRNEAASRPRRRPGPQSRGPVPRRTHDRTGSSQPCGGLVRGRSAESGARHDHLPHNAVSRRGGHLGRPGGHYLLWPPGSRRHSGRAQALRGPRRDRCRGRW